MEVAPPCSPPDECSNCGTDEFGYVSTRNLRRRPSRNLPGRAAHPGPRGGGPGVEDGRRRACPGRAERQARMNGSNHQRLSRAVPVIRCCDLTDQSPATSRRQRRPPGCLALAGNLDRSYCCGTTGNQGHPSAIEGAGLWDGCASPKCPASAHLPPRTHGVDLFPGLLWALPTQHRPRRIAPLRPVAVAAR